MGHSHYPLVWTERDGRANGFLLDASAPVPLDRRQRVIVNPGSVGQPRDGDWRASYLIYDGDEEDGDGTLQHYRVEYDIATAQARILDAGLPESLAYRLSDGR